MVSNVKSNSAAGFPNLAKYNKERSNIEFKNVTRLISDKVEISREARAASISPPDTEEEKDDSFEQTLEEYINSGGAGLNGTTNDDPGAEGRTRLIAMKIAMRIAKGDHVPMQDHRFLAEYDSKLYMAAMKASMIAQNDDPEIHESLADELLSNDGEAEDVEGQDLDSVNAGATDAADAQADSVDVYT